ncbi:RDD family protein [Nocardiopsis gilva]|uniref:RDD family protein n=1 Tax=Nocardiopsis gilva TaxID=280236 RepID=UPI0012FDA02A|nr:RDD family protein [Nocardiopsis gilva]
MTTPSWNAPNSGYPAQGAPAPQDEDGGYGPSPDAGPNSPIPPSTPTHGYPQPGYGPPSPGYPGYPGYAGAPAAPPAPLASWGQRVAAHLFDTAIIILMAAVIVGAGVWVGYVLTSDGPVKGYVVASLVVLTLGAVFAATFCYRWLSHAKSGQTLGKRALGIQVVSLDTLRPPTKMASAGRELIFRALGMGGSFVGTLLDLLWPLWDEPKRQTLHDKAVSTIVIEK